VKLVIRNENNPTHIGTASARVITGENVSCHSKICFTGSVLYHKEVLNPVNVVTCTVILTKLQIRV
jgi:hypothetical protein